MEFKDLIVSLEAGETEKAVQIAKALQPKFESTVAELKTKEGQLTDAIESRDKAKANLKAVGDAMGVSVEEVTADKVKELIKYGKNEEAFKTEVANLQKIIADNKDAHDQAIKSHEAKFKDKLVEIEISKHSVGSDVVNDKALALVISALKEGAEVDEDGHIVYKDDKGIKRDGAGRPIGVADMLQKFKDDEANQFLFKSSANGGGGSKPNGENSTTTKTFGEMSGGELKKLRAENPAEYDRLRSEYYNK